MQAILDRNSIYHYFIHAYIMRDCRQCPHYSIIPAHNKNAVVHGIPVSVLPVRPNTGAEIILLFGINLLPVRNI